jgi:DNA-binding CsgD family transcriptional regulator
VRNGPTASAQPALVGRREECAKLVRFLDGVRRGEGTALVVRGEAGVGKSSLLAYAASRASDFQVLHATGVEGEADLPYGALHQLCVPLRSEIEGLPAPQREALGVAFGLAAGSAPSRYHVALAVLSLLSEAAVARPVLCLIDDAQWMDELTIQGLEFVARRLLADRVGLLAAVREPHDVLGGLGEVGLDGLRDPDARALLDTLVVGTVDDDVRERLLAEAHGNPLALVELARSLTFADAGVGVSDGRRLASRIEGGYLRRVRELPDDVQRLLLIAASEPLGDVDLLQRAAAAAGISFEVSDAAVESGLIEIGERLTFCHPLARSAVYRAAAARARRSAHSTLAEATDVERDPDRRAWHRAQASLGPDEGVADDLERTAERARARGGVAAAAAFLEHAVRFTPTSAPARRADRALAAAEWKFEAGAYDDASRLLQLARPAASRNELLSAQVDRLQAKVAWARDGDAQDVVQKLLDAARRLLPLDEPGARETALDAFVVAAHVSSRELLRPVCKALEEFPPWGHSPIESLFQGYAELLTEGFPAGTETMRRAMIALRDQTDVAKEEVEAVNFAGSVAEALWDLDSLLAIRERVVRWMRAQGALATLPDALDFLSVAQVHAGRLRAAAASEQEGQTIREVTRTGREALTAPLMAWAADEATAIAHFATLDSGAEDRDAILEEWARAMLYNGLGRYELALEAAQRSCDLHASGAWGQGLVELIEAAQRVGETARAEAALVLLEPRIRLGGTDWALGVEARLRALLHEGAAAESLYREAIERLERTPARTALARAHLVYGEWLRRENRRQDARAALRRAFEMFVEMGAGVFTERAERELLATGETVRKRTDDTRGDLTPQEAQIARLASDRLTNPEIAAQLYLSPRTVEYHLRKVFQKLGISSRRELANALSASRSELIPA